MPQVATVLPKYRQIADHIRDQILRGDYLPGAEILSERQLAREWQVSRPTAARALQVLRIEGLAESRQGSGTYVRDLRARRRALRRSYRLGQRGAYGPDESVEITDAGIVEAPDYAAAAFGLDVPARAMRRRQLVSRDGSGPVEIVTSWWPAELATSAPRLLVRESLGGGGSVGYVESVTGRRASYAREQVAAQLASDQEVTELRLPAGPQAVLCYRHTVYDADDQPMEFAEVVYPPGWWTVEQEYRLEA
jgi:DNA-binding GntR family transcriptional regulator